MKFFRPFFDLIFFGNIYVAIGAVCLIQSSVIQLQLTNHLFFYSFLSFFATIFVYNLQRIFYKPQKNIGLHSVRRHWIFSNQRIIKFLAFIGFIGVVITFFFNDFKIIFYLSPLLLLSIFYFLPGIKLRQSPLFKLMILVFVWTMVTAVLPILLNGETFISISNLLHVSIRFCFMMAICIPFDIRDLKIDNADGISTIPKIIGEKKTRWLTLFFIILCNLLIIFGLSVGIISSIVFWPLFLSTIFTSIFLFFTSSRRGEYFYVAGIDGTMILQYLLLILI